MISIRETSLSEVIHLGKEIKGCELAYTDKAKCIICKKFIAQGTPRLFVFGDLKQAPPDEGIIKIKRFICYKCSSMIIDSKEKDYMETIKENREKLIETKRKLLDQNKIKEKFERLLKIDSIKQKIRNDEIIKELEKEDGIHLDW